MALLRLIYLVQISLGVPASLWYIGGQSHSYVHFPPVVFLTLIYLGGTAFLVFLIVLTQAHFPTNTAAAALTVATVFLNGFAGSMLNGFNFFHGAFSIVTCNLFGLAVYFLFLLAKMFSKEGRDGISSAYSVRNTIILFIALLISFSCLLSIYGGILLHEISHTDSIFLSGMYLTAFGTNLLQVSRNYIRMNMILEKDADFFSEIPTGPFLGCVIVSMLASLAIAGAITAKSS